MPTISMTYLWVEEVYVENVNAKITLHHKNIHARSHTTHTSAAGASCQNALRSIRIVEWTKKQHKLRTKVYLLQWQNSWFSSPLWLRFFFLFFFFFFLKKLHFFIDALKLKPFHFSCFVLLLLPAKYTWSLYSTRNGRRLPLILSCKNTQSSNLLCYNHVFVTTQINNAKMCVFFFFFSGFVLVSTKTKESLSLYLTKKFARYRSRFKSSVVAWSVFFCFWTKLSNEIKNKATKKWDESDRKKNCAERMHKIQLTVYKSFTFCVWFQNLKGDQEKTQIETIKYCVYRLIDAGASVDAISVVIIIVCHASAGVCMCAVKYLQLANSGFIFGDVLFSFGWPQSCQTKIHIRWINPK